MHTNKNKMLPFALESIFEIIDEFSDIEQFLRNKKAYPNYPPSNIYTNSENHTYVIQYAVAGWRAEQLHVEAESDYKLVISGDERPKLKGDNIQELHQGIALRDFKREFSFTESIKNVDVELENGILTVIVSFKEKDNNKKTFDIKNK